MYQYDVFHDGRIAGRAEAAEDGLYWNVRVRCAMPDGGILRACAENVTQRLPLGVLLPEGEEGLLTRRIPRSRFSFYPDTQLTLDTAPYWQDFSGLAAGWPLPGGRVCRCDGGATVLLPADAQRPFVCMPLFCFFSLVSRHGRRYWRLSLDAENNPVMPKDRPEG